MRRRRSRRWSDWPEYVPVTARRAVATKHMERLKKKGLQVQPVEISGNTIAKTFWGSSWCDHLESFSDYSNRLPRGRSYVRNGSVCHLEIETGKVTAFVAGTGLYTVTVAVSPLPVNKWQDIKNKCSGKISSILELLRGKLSDSVMAAVTDRRNGLFPLRGEIEFRCSCPDRAMMCKHVAAVFYGIGARLDTQPELLFLLRGVESEELISGIEESITTKDVKGGKRRIASGALSELFGIDLRSADRKEMMETAARPAAKKAGRARKKAGKKTRKGAATPYVLPDVLTGKDVAMIRADLGLTKSSFARLVGVSLPTITNWEEAHGTLKLQERSLKKLRKATKTMTCSLAIK